MVQTVSDRHDLAHKINCPRGRGFGWACSQAGAGGPSVAFEEFARIWDGVLDGTPGFEAFGYVSTDACISCSPSCSTVGMCADPDHTFYYIPG